jgi:hypothetical protein
MKALIKDNLVVDVCETEFEVHPSLVWVDAAEGCVVGWTYENGQFIAPIQPQITYSQNRARAYPSIQEQLDMQYWDSVNGTTTWADAITAVKEEFPKP